MRIRQAEELEKLKDYRAHEKLLKAQKMVEDEANRVAKMKANEEEVAVQERDRLEIVRQMAETQLAFTDNEDEYENLPNGQGDKFYEEYVVLST